MRRIGIDSMLTKKTKRKHKRRSNNFAISTIIIERYVMIVDNQYIANLTRNLRKGKENKEKQH